MPPQNDYDESSSIHHTGSPPEYSSASNQGQQSPNSSYHLPDEFRIRAAEQLLSPEGLKLQSNIFNLRGQIPEYGSTAEDLLTSVMSSATKRQYALQKWLTKILPPEIEKREPNGLWCRMPIFRGTRYGPYSGKLTSKIKDVRYAWQVCRF